MRRALQRIIWIGGLPLRAALLGLIHAYRALISPMVAGRCRFHPSCSAYAEEAVRVHGALKGGVLAAWRVARCSPLSGGGVDRVPPRGAWRGGEQPTEDGSAGRYDDVIRKAG